MTKLRRAALAPHQPSRASRQADSALRQLLPRAHRGQKRSETEDKVKQFSERFYGRFERRIRLGYEVQEDKVDAHFRNGVLTVTLPKSEKAQSQVKRIAIKN
ncbi:hypothetical protein FHW20_004210 [Ochrobactrum intermedium]|uniref:SHSP domain-containing protein n=1 Tax=Brucella intermedia TaxID=94625 RepID=A0ABR6AUS7_9HYPH|nr:hypothetical protein [Brucella intermedia]NYD80408.1 hypothetical protein [Brucella intermedia]